MAGNNEVELSKLAKDAEKNLEKEQKDLSSGKLSVKEAANLENANNVMKKRLDTLKKSFDGAKTHLLTEFKGAAAGVNSGIDAGIRYINDAEAAIKNIESSIDEANKKIEEYKSIFTNFVGSVKQRQAQAAKLFNETKGHFNNIVNAFKSFMNKLNSLFEKLKADYDHIKNSPAMKELAAATEKAIAEAEIAAEEVGTVAVDVGDGIEAASPYLAEAVIISAGEQVGGLPGGPLNRDFSIYRPDGRAWVLNGLIFIIAILIIVMLYLIYYVGCECTTHTAHPAHPTHKIKNTRYW